MNAPPAKQLDEDLEGPLETIELELVLEAQELPGATFEHRVQSALRAVSGTLLFYMPEDCRPGISRLAAVTTGNADERKTLLVLLEEDGDTVRVESCGDESGPVGAVAQSFALLSERF